MNSLRPLKFKIATEEWEFELVHRLNYRTFVEEIPQHSASSTPRLVDKFHAENTYIICLDGPVLAGMIAIRGKRPFSLDHKLPNLDDFLPSGRRICEIRLLAVEKEYRNGRVFRGLAEFLAQYGTTLGYDMAVISGTTRQQKLYQHLGFKPFGPLVGTPDAQFHPMYLTLEAFVEQAKALAPRAQSEDKPPVSFLPGPVYIHPTVQKALSQNPISHRSDAFQLNLQVIKQRLLQLTGARRVEILVGSGTLANDVIGGQLAVSGKSGLIISNGEFGDRLIDHATRFRLSFKTHQVAWGEPFDLCAVERQVEQAAELDWVWAVHCETSTGVLNDLDGLRGICDRHNLKLCLDCISSIGTTPVSLHGVYLASGVSGKGLAAFPGLSMVFYHHQPRSAPGVLPRYLDLGYYAACEGVPFTHSSNLLWALLTALRRWDDKRFDELVGVAAWLRHELRQMDLQVLAPEAHASPAVVTIVLPPHISSRTVGKQLQRSGYLLSYGSEYLLQRNWIQICLMGEFTRDNIVGLLGELRRLCAARVAPGCDLKAAIPSDLGVIEAASPAQPRCLPNEPPATHPQQNHPP
jgi:aspartate aminotransferase-like enzyme/GNAT superfamily N-acetyltransferase